jgi:putative flippase GtrA
MSASRNNWARWLRFNAVGALGICIQLAVLALLRSGLGMNYLLATAPAVEVTVLHNFFWHEKFTWSDRKTSDRFVRLLKFNLTIGGLSIIGNVMAMKLLVGMAGVNYVAANSISITVCSILNFIVADRAIFLAEAARTDSGLSS